MDFAFDHIYKQKFFLFPILLDILNFSCLEMFYSALMIAQNEKKLLYKSQMSKTR